MPRRSVITKDMLLFKKTRKDIEKRHTQRRYVKAWRGVTEAEKGRWESTRDAGDRDITGSDLSASRANEMAHTNSIVDPIPKSHGPCVEMRGPALNGGCVITVLSRRHLNGKNRSDGCVLGRCGGVTGIHSSEERAREFANPFSPALVLRTRGATRVP
jgi:hypothetical protein